MKNVLLLVSVVVLFVTGMAFSQLTTIDAEKDAFFSTLTGPADGFIFMPHQVDNDNYSTVPAPTSDTDISAKIWFGWDETYLYVYEEVKDDVVLVNNATEYQNDKLELKIDPDPSQKPGTSAGNYDVSMSALDSTDAAVVASVRNPAPKGDYARKLTADGYVLEYKKKWADIISGTRGPIVPAVGGKFGMAIMNHDDDAVQRDATIEWAAALHDNVWNNPQMLGTVEFLADNKLKFTAVNAIDTTVVNAHPEWYDPTLENALVFVDGVKDDFFATLTGPDDGYLWMPHQSFNDNYATLPPPASDADISASVWFAWDADYLYCYEEVTDDIVLVNNATEYLNDKLELKIDPDPSQMAGTSAGNYGVGFSAFDAKTAAVPAGVTTPDGPSFRKKTPTGYTLEFKLAWSKIVSGTRGPIVPEVGKKFGMAVMNHDDDAVQREATIEWAAALHDNVWNNPQMLGTVEFLADNKLKFTAINAIVDTVVNAKASMYDPANKPTGVDFLVVDGKKDDFFKTLTGPANGYLYLPSKAYNDNYATLPPPASDTDISAQFWSAWDDQYLYVYEEVRDDIVLVNNATEYLNDKLELKIDPDPSKAAGASAGNYGVNLSALDSAAATVKGGVTQPPAGQFARVKTATGYALEMKVKWADMVSGTRGPVVPAAGTKFGMAVMNHDNDAVQREATIEWAAALHDNVWNNPQMLGTVELFANHQLKYTPTNAIVDTVKLSTAAAKIYNPSNIPASLDLLVIDAKKDDWFKALTGPANGYVYLPSKAFNQNGAARNDKDLSALVWTAWDANFLYIYEEVADDTLMCSNAANYNNDKLEIKIDPDPTVAPTAGVCDFGMTALDSADATNKAGVANPAKGNFARVKTKVGYNLEMRVAWSAMTTTSGPARGPVVPAVNKTFGMAINTHDNDATGRTASIEWAAVLDDHVWDNPQMHGTVTFLADGKLKLTAKNAITGVALTDAAKLYDPKGVILDVAPEKTDKIAESYSLSQNYPNPFNPTTNINFELPKQSKVELVIYNMLGEVVAKLVDDSRPAGRYSITFDGSRLSSGVYFYRLAAGDQVFVKKMMLVK